jgi:hypothetical protein
MESEPVRDPEVLGVKVTLIVQFALGARVEPHVLVCAKFALVVMPVILSIAAPEFVSVRGKFPLGVPTSWMPKVKLAGEKETFGDPPPQPQIKQVPRSMTPKELFISASSLPG